MNPGIYHKNGRAIEVVYKNEHGQRHRIDGPAYQRFHENGQLEYEQFWVNDKLHRIDGPAYRRFNENGQLEYEQFWVNGQRHRIDGPAVQSYFVNGQLFMEEYWTNGQHLRRKNGKWENKMH